MAVIYINGFELNYAIGPLSTSPSDNVDGYWDFNNDFGWSTQNFNYPLASRIGGGQALTVGTQLGGGFGSAGLRSIGFPSPNNTIRIGFEFNTQLPSSQKTMFQVGRSSRTFQITVNPAGNLTAYDVPGNGWGAHTTGVSLGSLGAFSTVGYTRLEIYYQQTTGIIRVWKNGDLLLDTVMTTTAATFNSPAFPQAPVFSTGHVYNIDNIWATDGSALVDGLNAVQVHAALDDYDAGLTAGLRGSLVFGDAQYQTDWKASGVSSQLTTLSWVLDKNVANDVKFIYPINPNTGLAWDTSDLGTFKWGVCYAHAFSVSTPTVRVAGLALSTLSVEDGAPVVTYYEPGNLTFFSGPWTKNQTEKTYAANVRGLPRANILEIEDAPCLFINGLGCIFFDSQGETPEPPLDTIGITFAEEFRTDYRDWVRVTGTGFSFDSYFIAGYGVYGEGNRQFQNNYVTVNYRNVPTGGAYIQGLWDYSFDPDNGRWSMRQQVYHNSEGQTHGMRKLKIRGHGKALQIRVISDGDKPFDINGWTLLITSNVSV